MNGRAGTSPVVSRQSWREVLRHPAMSFCPSSPILCLRLSHQRSSPSPRSPTASWESLEPALLQVVWLIPGLTPPAQERDPSPRSCWLARWPCRVDPCHWNVLLLRELPEVESDAGEVRRRLGLALEPSCAPCPAASGLVPSLCICPRDSRRVLTGAGRVIWGSWGPWSSCPGCGGMRGVEAAIYSSEGVNSPPDSGFRA